MNSYLLNRALGSVSQQTLARAQNTRLVHALQPAPHVSLSIKAPHQGANTDGQEDNTARKAIAHPAGVNSITIDRFEGRYLLSGGADSSIAIWDLEAPSATPSSTTGHIGGTDTGVSRPTSQPIHIAPLAYAARTSRQHNYGITHVSFYPFDSLAFLASSYDHSLTLYSAETLAASATFDLAAVVHAHALSPVAPHLLVACATQHPAVRLVDLRSGASTHSLAGHTGAVLGVAWHPRHEHLLASAGADGLVRLWDIRRSANSLGVVDMDDSVGIAGHDGLGGRARAREKGKAHAGPANGVLWTDGGEYLVSTGHDEKVRVWEMDSGANTLTNFGPAVKNGHTSTLLPLVTPSALTPPGMELLVFPNPRELLVFELHTGKLISRLRTPSYASSHTAVGAGSGTRNVLNRTTSLAWRAHTVELYSAHTDGSIRCWQPRTWEDGLAEGEESDEDDEEQEARDRKRKREELDDIVKSLTKRQVTFI